MIVCKVDSVYEVNLPAELRYLLAQIERIITLNLDFGTPLECLGYSGYTPQLAVMMAIPYVLSFTSFFAALLWQIIRLRGLLGPQCWAAIYHKWWSVVHLSALAALPVALRISFLAWPVVSNKAFEAFP